MGNFIEEFTMSSSAGSAYLKGIELFGFAPVESYMADPRNERWLGIGVATRRVLAIVDRSQHLERSTFIRMLNSNFNDSKMKEALRDVQSKLTSMFGAAHPSWVAPALMSAVETLSSELFRLSRAIETTKADYLNSIKETRRQQLREETEKMQVLDRELDVAVRSFNSEGRNISMAAAVAIEREQPAAAEHDPMVTWARFSLADASERLYRLGGDLPRDLQLRESDGDLRSFLAYAASGIGNVPADQGKSDHLSAFADALSKFEAAKAAGDVKRAALMTDMATRLDQFGDAIDRMARDKVPALADAVELSMVVAETVRGVLGMKRRGFGTSRAEEAIANPLEYQRKNAEAVAVRGNLARERADRKRKAEEGRGEHEAR